MRTIRVLAVLTTVLVGLYFAFRAVVATCTGPACDAYIPVSLLLPLLILAMVAITGISATVLARPQRAWSGILLAVTVLGVLGPPIALLIFKDQPDVLVPAATILELAVAISVFAFSFSNRQKSAAQAPGAGSSR